MCRIGWSTCFGNVLNGYFVKTSQGRLNYQQNTSVNANFGRIKMDVDIILTISDTMDTVQINQWHDSTFPVMQTHGTLFLKRLTWTWLGEWELCYKFHAHDLSCTLVCGIVPGGSWEESTINVNLVKGEIMERIIKFGDTRDFSCWNLEQKSNHWGYSADHAESVEGNGKILFFRLRPFFTLQFCFL